MEQNQQEKLSLDERKGVTKRKYQSLSTKIQHNWEIEKGDDSSDSENEELWVRTL